MQHQEPRAAPTISIFCLHFLGGSARSWDAVARRLPAEIACIPLDLPGFGDASAEGGYSVAAMADRIAGHIKATGAPRWWIAGHSMGAKVALAIARRAENGESELAGLEGVALVAGSPPSPEPMPDAKRAEMLAWIDREGRIRRAKARGYVHDNVSVPLGQEAEDRAVADVLRASPDAWKAWLTDGSREDWRNTVGTLSTPALVLSSSDDEALGPQAQEKLMLPHLAAPRHITLNGAGHLLPLERAEDVARHLRDACLG